MPNRRDDSIYSVDSTEIKIAYIRCHIYSDREIHVITSSSSVLEFFICHIFPLQCLHNFLKQIKIFRRKLVLNSSHRQWNWVVTLRKSTRSKSYTIIQNNWNSIANTNANVNCHQNDAPVACSMAVSHSILDMILVPLCGRVIKVTFDFTSNLHWIKQKASPLLCFLMYAFVWDEVFGWVPECAHTVHCVLESFFFLLFLSLRLQDKRPFVHRKPKCKKLIRSLLRHITIIR